MPLPTVHPARRASDPLSWGVLVALAAIAALLLTQAASASGVFRSASSQPSALRLAAASKTAAAGSSQTAGTSGTTGAMGSSSGSSPKKIAVSISGYAFKPASLTINVGDTVTWTNMDSAPHTVTSSSGPDKLDSPELQKGQSWSFTFRKAGSYSYYCAVHPDMKGSVTVKGSSSGGGMSGGPNPGSCEPSLVSAVADPFWMHVKKGHLEESPGQQAKDILNTDQYVKTHTALIESMAGTAEQEATSHAMDGPSTFWMHVKKGHLGESPGQQVNDILNPDQYIKTHTVLIGDMLTPYVDMVTGTC
jgi:amicyanin